jgi:hypothetical protein
MASFDPLNPLSNEERYRRAYDYQETQGSLWPSVVLVVGLIAVMALIALI